MLTNEEQARLQELVWKNEARAGRPKEYYAQSQAPSETVPQTCTHDVTECCVCLIAEAVANERERCAKIAEEIADVCNEQREADVASEIADLIRQK